MVIKPVKIRPKLEIKVLKSFSILALPDFVEDDENENKKTKKSPRRRKVALKSIGT